MVHSLALKRRVRRLGSACGFVALTLITFACTDLGGSSGGSEGAVATSTAALEPLTTAEIEAIRLSRVTPGTAPESLPPSAIPPFLKGEFRVDDNGVAHYSVPLTIPKGQVGATPSVSLNYRSDRRYGPFGYGWALNVGVAPINQCGFDPYYDEHPTFPDLSTGQRWCMGGKPFVNLGGHSYAAVENSNIRMERVGTDKFKVFMENGSVVTYDAQQPFSAIKSADNLTFMIFPTQHEYFGHTIVFEYSTAPGTLDYISYAGFFIDIDYASVAQPTSPLAKQYLLGREVPRIGHVERIRISGRGQEIQYRLTQEDVEDDFPQYIAQSQKPTKLKRIELCVGSTAECSNPIELSYTGRGWDRKKAYKQNAGPSLPVNYEQFIVMNFDGKPGDELVAFDFIAGEPLERYRSAITAYTAGATGKVFYFDDSGITHSEDLDLSAIDFDIFSRRRGSKYVNNTDTSYNALSGYWTFQNAAMRAVDINGDGKDEILYTTFLGSNTCRPGANGRCAGTTFFDDRAPHPVSGDRHVWASTMGAIGLNALIHTGSDPVRGQKLEHVALTDFHLGPQHTGYDLEDIFGNTEHSTQIAGYTNALLQRMFTGDLNSDGDNELIVCAPRSSDKKNVIMSNSSAAWQMAPGGAGFGPNNSGPIQSESMTEFGKNLQRVTTAEMGEHFPGYLNDFLPASELMPILLSFDQRQTNISSPEVSAWTSFRNNASDFVKVEQDKLPSDLRKRCSNIVGIFDNDRDGRDELVYWKEVRVDRVTARGPPYAPEPNIPVNIEIVTQGYERSATGDLQIDYGDRSVRNIPVQPGFVPIHRHFLTDNSRRECMHSNAVRSTPEMIEYTLYRTSANEDPSSGCRYRIWDAQLHDNEFYTAFNHVYGSGGLIDDCPWNGDWAQGNGWTGIDRDDFFPLKKETDPSAGYIYRKHNCACKKPRGAFNGCSSDEFHYARFYVDYYNPRYQTDLRVYDSIFRHGINIEAVDVNGDGNYDLQLSFDFISNCMFDEFGRPEHD